MKVAILGAGPAGLSCALELKRNGITPTIFEKKSYVGEDYALPAASLRIFNPHYNNPIKYLKRRYNLNIYPKNKIEKITMKSPSKEIKVKGNLGYVLMRGMEKNSLENQIFSLLNIPVLFDRYGTIKDLKRVFDFIIVATGSCDIAKNMDVFDRDFNVYARSATILGNFDETHIKMWLNTEYAKNAFAFIMPLSKDHARLTLMVNNISHHELPFYWDRFIKTENIKYNIIEIRDLEHNLGSVYPLKKDNIYFVGDAAGLVDSFVGFGVIAAIESGFISARCILENLNYNNLMKPYLDNRKKLYEFRKSINTMDNNELDRLLMLLGTPLIKQFIYSNPFFKIQRVWKLAKLFNGINKI
ncbi:NAD(P)/FAD-dependent oxidoreductase [Herbivorax sp. ANBcel31]|uniref:FAD-dependent monooxygenase n=1 Tax=Herbivorax sp. ANBcel31 TaxID=3069754 RepID=UPI0027B81037|nr:NAD(P)/FAD-dependent oxidoreductase [Herbivorax sp. ANBcel31]MDQ2085575.1 NAD(P)/FAD-dependent oxidoreductase [Herbivorax sp. ANBcel31]